MAKCYLRQSVIFLGIPGNMLSCAVFSKQGLSDRINLLLFWLAVADLTNLVTQLMFNPSCYLSDGVQAHNWDTVFHAKIVYINLWSAFVSGILIVIMSVDRCLSVAVPLKARRLLSHRPMVVAILLSYLVPLVCYLPGFLSFTVKWRTDPSSNRSVAYMAVSNWIPLDNRFAILIIDLLVLIVKPISLVIVVVCCVITIVFLRKASRKRLQMTGATNKEESEVGENRITKMLLFLCFTYAVLILPEICSHITNAFIPEYFVYRRYHKIFVMVYEVVILTASSVNSTVNFFTYLVLSSKFRATLMDLCCCFRRESVKAK
ncbi:putative G-protein coupled receptor B0563.6 [Babylonia areolata]|uniref:putative G-protein coupled receptor B0563.6 n=1 Tax=Babylonia areolata TaxID=304850 RepID=UPI003FD0F1CF